jgi:hypothetical protein
MKNPSGGNCPEQEHWTLTHAFYANMGGLVIDTKSIDGKEYIAGSPRLTVTARGAHFLALNGIIPEISESFIEDKSKASSFAKVFACTQGIWLIIQSIARLCYRLPITLLEINTIGHVLCALAIYVFWLRKPLDIEEPSVINDHNFPDLQSLCALMWMNSSVSERGIRRHPKASKTGTELESLLFYMSAANHQGEFRNNDQMESSTRNSHSLSPGQPSLTVVSLDSEETQIKLSQNQVIDNIGFALNPQSQRFDKVIFTRSQRLSSKMGRGSGPGIPKVIELDAIDIQRWQMSSQVLATRPSLLGETSFEEVGSRIENGFKSWKFKELLCTRAPDWPGKSLEGREATLFNMKRDHLTFNWFLLFLAMATALYGGLHAAAWNGYFPTESERNWWRFSSVIVGASGLAFITLSLLGSAINYLNQHDVWGGILLFINIYFIFIVGIGFAGAFVISRTYLMVEAFISFRRLPVAAYISPAWLQDLVHL